MRKQIDTKINSVTPVVEALLNYADTFSFVIRENEAISSKVNELLDILKPCLIEKKKVSQWPGTKLLWNQATLFTYNFNKQSMEVLCKTQDNFSKWLHPHLPEDLVFYRSNVPIFVSIAHEKDCYFEVDKTQEIYLRNVGLI